MSIAAAALDYASRGWRVVPLYGLNGGRACECGRCGPGGSSGKHPRVKGWQKVASSDEETIAGWWGRWPLSNVGVKLGAESGIIDFETDNEAGEELLLRIFDGEVPFTPTWQSGKGKHRLFRYNPALPQMGSMPIKVGAQHVADIKIGSGDLGSQSVFPPSLHHSGITYRWLITPDEAEPAELSDLVVTRLVNWNGLDSFEDLETKRKKKTAEEWDAITAPKVEGQGRNIQETQIVGNLLRQCTNVEDPASIKLIYQAARAMDMMNTPPQDEADFKATFLSILKRERTRRMAEATELTKPPSMLVDEASAPPAGAGAEQPGKAAGGMKLIIIEDDPPVYELHCPMFQNEPRAIILTCAQLCSFDALRVQAIEQAQYPLPKSFKKPWDAKGGILETLILHAEKRQVSPVTHALAAAADYLLERLSTAKSNAGDERNPNPRQPTLMEDGSVWFRWTEFWADATAGRQVDKATPRRLAHALGLTASDVVRHPPRGNDRKRYTVMSRGLLERLKQLAKGEEPTDGDSPLDTAFGTPPDGAPAAPYIGTP